MKKSSELNWSYIYHQSSKEHLLIPTDETKWPKEWTTVFYKSYPRFPAFKLPRPDFPRVDLGDVIRNRKTIRHFEITEVSLREIALILQYGCGIVNTSTNMYGQFFHRGYPSGGARYPVEIYCLVNRCEALSAGVYHYNVKAHAMERLINAKVLITAGLDELFTYPWAKDAAIVFFMTSVFYRSQEKYGERGYRYILLEAGHIAQNIVLISGAIGLTSCPLTGTYDAVVEKLLGVDGISESLIYTVLVNR